MAVSVFPGNSDPTHHVSLSADGETYGLLFGDGQPKALQSIPASSPPQMFELGQESWLSGRGRKNFKDDPMGYYDGHHFWSAVDKAAMPTPAYKFATGLRNESTYITHSKTFWPIWASGQASGPTLYVSQAFTPTMNITADYARIYVKRVGTPKGNLTLELCSQSGSDPNTVLQTVTKSITDVTDYLTLFLKFDWSGTQALTSGTTYHLKLYGNSADNGENHWEIGVDASTASARTNTTNGAAGTYSAATFKILWRVCDADVKRRFFSWQWDGMKYFVTSSEDGTASKIFINGDRGNATGAQISTALKDTNKAWTVNIWAGASVWIMDGTADGQIRTIVSNTADTLTVAAWDVTPIAYSATGYARYIIFDTTAFTEITGHGLAKVVANPISVLGITYFPQGQTTVIRRARLSTTSGYDYAAETQNSDMFALSTQDKDLLLYSMNGAQSTLGFQSVKTLAWGTPLTIPTYVNRTTTVPIGTSDYRITNMQPSGATLFVIKEDSLYVIDAGVTRKLSINMAALPSRNNGLAMWAVENYVYFSFSGSIERIIGSAVSDVMNFRSTYDGLPSDRTGTPMSGENLIAQSFVSIDGGTANTSSVMAWNDMGWFEVFRGFEAGTRIKNATFQTMPGVRPRLWIDVGGDLVYQDYSLNAANPLKDTGMNYAHEFSFVSGRFDAGEPTLLKFIHELELLTENLSSVTTPTSPCKIEIDYQINEAVGTATWTRLPQDAIYSPRELITWDMGEINQWQFRVRAYTTTSTTPPVILAYNFTGDKMPPLKYQYNGTFKLGAGQQNLRGDDDHNPDTLEAWLKSLAKAQKKVVMRSLIKGDDKKVVRVFAPTLSRNSIDGKDWQGVMSLLFREWGDDGDI